MSVEQLQKTPLKKNTRKLWSDFKDIILQPAPTKTGCHLDVFRATA